METAIVNSSNISGLVQRTLNRVEPRLVDHGKRVAFLVAGMLKVQGKYGRQERQDICFIAMLHDVGAYKTEEINQMVKFESENIWNHSIYGYLFLRYLSPLRQWAEAVLYHHVSAKQLDGIECSCKDAAQMVNLADRVDMFYREYGPDWERLRNYLDENRENRYYSGIVDLFWEAERELSMLGRMEEEISFEDIVPEVELTREETDDYLKMLTYAIDFRSCHTVTHTITTTYISSSVAGLLGLDEDMRLHVYYGAMLHDLGKIGIPVEILEFPGRLSAQAMAIMRTHVDITEEILNGDIDQVTTKIALRHHEKMNGSGYPRRLKAESLTLAERIVAIADIVSALLGTRSYKESYSKDKVISIITEQADAGLLDSDVVNAIVEHFDEIIEEVGAQCDPILKIYNGINGEYNEMMRRYAAGELILNEKDRWK